MRKFGLFSLCLFLWLSTIAMADEIKGFWQTIDDKTKQPSSIIAIYTYQDKYYGRIIGIYESDGKIVDSIYNPIKKAPALAGDPYYCGLDIVTDVTPRDDGTYRGRVMDPRNGNVYKAELWRKSLNLVLRGKFLMFGKSVTWQPFPESHFDAQFKKPDLATFVPVKVASKD